MFKSDLPKTLEQAKKIRYGQWAGNPKGYAYKEGYCAEEVWIGWHARQCSRKAKAGPGCLYCGTHAKRFK